MKKFIKYFQYFLVVSCIVVFFFMLRDFNSNELKNIIKRIDYVFILTAMLFAATNIILKILRLKIISEQFHYKISFNLSFKTQVVSLIFALLTPGRVGEVSKIYLLSDGKKGKYTLITSILFFEIIIDFVCILIISFIFSALILKNIGISVFLGLLIIVCLGFAFFLTKGNKLKINLPRVISNFFKFMGDNKINFFHRLHITFIYSFLAWILDGVFQFYILKAVNIDSNMIMLTALSALTSIISIISILPLGLGVTDLSSLFLYDSFLGLKKEYILYLINSSRLFLILTLFILAIPFVKLLIKRDWMKKAIVSRQ